MIDDEQLAQAAAELANAIYESTPTSEVPAHQFSKRFEKKMSRLIQKANHPILYKFLRAAACFLLVMTIGFGSIMTVNAEAREFIAGWVKEQYKSFTRYFFSNEAESTESVKYQLGWLPDGCEFVTSFEIDGGETYFYTDERETLIHFTYTSDTKTTQVFVSSDGYTIESVLVNGCPSDIYIAKNAEETNTIVWMNADKNVLFIISGDFTADELIKIAESIKKS